MPILFFPNLTILHYLLILPTLLVALQLSVIKANAGQPAISCHCFQDRSFNSEIPEKVDPYLLATAQNSFLATVFNIEKRGIVQAKMQGADADILWISNFISAITSDAAKDIQSISHRLAKKWSGKELISEYALDPESMSPSIWLTLLKDSRGVKRDIAQAIVDDAVARRLEIEPSSIKKIRSIGVDNKELILSAIIAKRTKLTINDVYAERNTAPSWGYMADLAGIVPMEVDDLLKKMIPSFP